LTGSTDRTWTVRDALDWTAVYLADKGDEQPRLSAEWLLSAATGLSRVELYALCDRPLDDDERAMLREGVKRRAAGEPLQYVTGEMPFRHIIVHVRPGVLIPRPETELLVDEVLEGLPVGGTVIDLCTGSGCVGLSVAHERSDVRVWASDLDPLAVEVAAQNARRLGLTDRFTPVGGDLFAPLPSELKGLVDVVAANPPYVSTAELASLPDEVRDYEPRSALDGGSDGLAIVRRVARDAVEWLRPGGRLALECDERGARAAARLLQEWYEEVSLVQDLTGRDRIVSARAGAGFSAGGQ
jgi:release factor glutamine methyltransferase